MSDKIARNILSDDAVIGIVNRGEAAVRFIRAVREFNALHGTRLTTAVFFLELEREAMFVRQADIATPLATLQTFPGSGTTPYLCYQLMIEALQTTGCQAVWPGWGFLSENPDFVAMLEQSGITFLGPSSQAMRMLGDKMAAKRIAIATGVPIVPWSQGPLRNAELACQVAETIGYPVMLKAPQAGGGRGIRPVYRREEMATQFKAAGEEALRVTTEATLFLEKLVQRGRHLEVQVVADRYGQVFTFGVRDCSIQRRNQKLIEETPPAGLTQKTITALERSAVKLMKAAGYESAGTVEFIYDMVAKQFYFMEVNARLQVEHPISEAWYGQDLVKAQIMVARGERLKRPVKPHSGTVIEARLNAEDPDRDFTPAPGRVVLFRPPAGPGIRLDSGIEEGSLIPAQFDSMVAKIIAQGATRREAIARLTRALQELRVKIEGGTTNRAFLLELMKQSKIRNGAVHTRFVEALLAKRQPLIARDHWDIAIVACAIRQYGLHYLEELHNFRQKLGRASSPQQMAESLTQEITITLSGHAYRFRVKSLGNYLFHLEIGDQLLVVRYLWRQEQDVLIHRQQRYTIQTVVRGDLLQCEVNAVPYRLELESQGMVKAPAPAVVIASAVAIGQSVAKGELLITLEAMKMEMRVIAPQSGIVRAIHALKGQQVTTGQALIELEPIKGHDREQPAADAPQVSFARLAFQADDATCHEAYFEALAREFLALFLGYDYDEPVANLLKRLVAFGRLHNEFLGRIANKLMDAINIYLAVETLFATRQIQGDNLARPMDGPELLIHCSRHNQDRDQCLPEPFGRQVTEALAWYEWEGLGRDEEYMRSLFQLYKSHAHLEAKQTLLHAALRTLEEIAPLAHDPLDFQRLCELLDRLIELCQNKQSSLADAAIHARYSLVDRLVLQQLVEERRQRVAKLSQAMAVKPAAPDIGRHLWEAIADAGHTVLSELIQVAGAAGSDQRLLALELIARWFNRDRQFLTGELLTVQGGQVYRLDSMSEATRQTTLVTWLTESDYLTRRPWPIAALPQITPPPEVIFLIIVPELTREREEDICQKTQSEAITVAWLCLAMFTPSGKSSYRTFVPATATTMSPMSETSGGIEHRRADAAFWHEEDRRRYFNPLLYRELHMARFANFALSLLYHSDNVFLFRAVALHDPRDERFFALAQVAEIYADLKEESLLQRMAPFEAAFMEAVHAIRTEQARRRERLHWNRIIIHICSLLKTNLSQIQHYIARLAPRTVGLGLERMTIYARTATTGEGTPQEAEFVIENSPVENGTTARLTLRRRCPSPHLITPMDSYVVKVVKALQRGHTYPYEFIKLITRAAGYEKFPKGEFEEFDIEIVTATGQQRLVSVIKRPYGLNKANIVFGIITSFLPVHVQPLRRVIILGDPTNDMASLAEGECRRVIAALDLAEQQQLSVEWIAVSSGARIDMESGTENLDWTARALRRIIEFTQHGGEINVIVAGTNVGAQSYWNAEATMLMHTKGLLIMTGAGNMLLTGKKALDFSGSVSGDDNLDIGGIEKIMGPNGEAQVYADSLTHAYQLLLRHYDLTYCQPGKAFPQPWPTKDPVDRDVCRYPYHDTLDQGFQCIGDILSLERNPERKKPFDIRQVMQAVSDQDLGHLERWQLMKDAETAVVWEARIGGHSVGLIGIESKPLQRSGLTPNDGPSAWTGGTLFPLSSKKVARAINAFSAKVPVVALANLSGFDGSPESLRNCQLEFGAEIGRAIVNFAGPILFIVIARYHGGAYVVFSQSLNPHLKAMALQGTFASVIGGAPAAAVVFPRLISKESYSDPRIEEAKKRLQEDPAFRQKEFEEIFQKVYSEKQAGLAHRFDRIHCVERARTVGSISEIIPPHLLRPRLIEVIAEEMQKYLAAKGAAKQ